MEKNHKKLSCAIILLFFFLIIGFLGSDDNSNSKINSYDYGNNIKVPNLSNKLAVIHIDNNWTDAKILGICSGTGDFSDPYLIEDELINGSGYRNGILIQNSNDYFIIKNCSIF